jgi:GMP synthase-like glutamine amidotransferase
MTRALVLAHEPGGGACRVEERLVRRGVEVDTHFITTDIDRPDRAAAFPLLDGYDLLVVMGSVRSLTRKHEIEAWIDDEMALVRSAHESGLPVLGVCFGGQLLAEALGGSVEEAPVVEIGWYEIEPVTGPGDSGNPIDPGPWMEWHHDRFTPPPGAAVLARTAHAVQLFRIGRSVGTQFHPEVDAAHVATWLAGASDQYLSDVGVDRARMLAEVEANEEAGIVRCDRLVDWFLDDIAFPATERDPTRRTRPR